jgi:hypothetical protein
LRHARDQEHDKRAADSFHRELAAAQTSALQALAVPVARKAIATVMSANETNVVVLRPPASFLLELHSERMVDALLALQEAGFSVTYIRGSMNRYRIEDREKS